MTQNSVREALVASGVELLEETGNTDISLRAIARRAGVSHGAPRHWFPTHQLLLAAIAEVGLKDLEQAVLTEAKGREKTKNAARAYVNFAVERPAMFALAFRHDLLENSGASLREVSLPLFAWWSTLVDDEAAAIQLFTAVHGAAVLASTNALSVVAPTIDPGELTDSLVAAILRE